MNPDTEEDAFSAYIMANPLDEAGVRAYADWLLERGMVDRYEIVRFQYYLRMKNHSEKCPTTYPQEQLIAQFRDWILGLDTWRGKMV